MMNKVDKNTLSVLKEKYHQTFENLKRQVDGRVAFWYARDLQVVLDYGSWNKFKRVIQRAIKACKNSGQSIENYFSYLGKMVQIGSNVCREIEDFELSRYASIDILVREKTNCLNQV